MVTFILLNIGGWLESNIVWFSILYWLGSVLYIGRVLESNIGSE